MKKTKLIAIMVLIAVLAIALFTTLVACEPRGGEQTDSGSNTPSGSEDPDDQEGPKGPQGPGGPNVNPKPPVTPSMGAMDVFNKIIESVNIPEEALNIDAEVTADTQNQLTTINLKGNFYSETRKELCLAVYQQQKNSGGTLSQKQMVFAIYIVDDKIYLDMADGTPLIYLSDFDFNYVVQILQGSGELLGGLLESLDLSSYQGLIDFALGILFGNPQITDNADGSQSIKMEFRIKNLIGSAGTLIGMLVQLPVDIAPVLTYLAGLIPDDTLYVNAQFASDGSFTGAGLSGADTQTNNEKYKFDLSFQVRDTADLDIGLPGDLADRAISEFSFTNIQFAIDLVVDSVRDDYGNQKGFDLGSMINSFLGTSTTFRIPEGLLLLQGGTGVRLSFKLDLDLNYDKLPDDNNKIAIELFLINPDGTLAEFQPQMGIYYTDGSFYLNTDNLLPNYLNGLNIKLDASLTDLVSMLVDLITDAIDGVFGLDFAGLRKSELSVNDNGSLNLASMSAVQKVLSTTNARVVALSAEDDGSFKLSAGIGGFVDAIASLLGLGGDNPNIFVDGSSIKLVVNDNFFDTLGGLIPALKSIKLPNEIGDIVLSINTSEVGLDNITVSTTLNNTSEKPGPNDSTIVIKDPAFAASLSIGDFLIGFKDDTFADYIDGRVGGGDNYLASLNGVIDHILGGIRFSSGFTMKFDKGTYDLAPFIAGFGVAEVENSRILWTFDNDFILDASLNLQIALNRTDTAKSMIVLELKTESGIRVGNHQIIQPGKVLLGIYGYNNNIYIDISNLNIAGIVLPKLSFSLNFTDLIYTLLDNVIGDLLTQINVQGGDLKFELNFKELFGLTSAIAQSADNGATQNTSGIATYAQTREVDPTTAIILAFNTEKFVPTISLAAILALLGAANTDIGNTLAEALSLMEVDLSVELGRKDGFIFSFSGDFIPKLDDNGESVYYFDDKGQPIAREEGKIYKNIKEKPTGDENAKENIVYYTSKKYNYGSNMKLVFAAGTSDNPVIVGNLGSSKYPIEEKAQEFNDYKSDLIDAILGTVGKASVVLDIDLRTLDNEMNLTRLINNILANAGKKLELPMFLDLDDWSAKVQLSISWDLDLTRFSNSKIALELKFEQKNILALYIHRNSIIVDLTGLGLFSGEIVNSTIVTKVFSMVDGLIKDIGNLDLNDIINDLLKNAGLPTVGTTPEGTDKLALGEEVATDSGVAMIGENLEIKDFIKYLTEAIHLENTAIVIDFTSSIINGMLNDLVGVNLGLNLGLDGVFDLFGDSFNMGFKVEDIEMDLALSLSLGKDVNIPIDFDDVPDWDATSGSRFVTTLLNNLDIGFTIDLANYTNDVVNLDGDVKNVADDFTMYTRIIIEKVTASAGKKLVNVKGTPVAPQGSFVVTLAHINKAMYDDNQSSAASAQPLVYVVLDHRKSSKQMSLAICSGLVNFIVDIGDAVGVQEIDLDLVGMLAPVIDNLFSSIDGLLSNNNSVSQASVADAPTTRAAEVATDEPTGLNKVFADLDVIKLLGERGVMLSLRANGTFNVKVEFDPYLINKLIDDIMGYVFAKGTGHASILNLQEMAPDMFNQDYLSQITWTREKYGDKGKSGTFWGDFRAVLDPLLKNLITALGYGGLSFLTGLIPESVYNQVRTIVSGILPFAVWNSAILEVNIVDATISNIHFRGQDEFKDICIDGDPTKVAYKYDTKVNDARGSWKNASNPNLGFFTEIFIYNSSKSVGTSTGDGENNGLVTWADIPVDITFMPYIYESIDDGVNKLIDTYFTDKVAIYQKGTDIMRAKVVFKIIDGNSEINMGVANLRSRLSKAGTFKIKAIANFSRGITKELIINVEARDDGGGLKSIDDIEMHAYDDSLPDFLTIVTNDGKSRKINTEYLTVTGWRPTDYKAHDVKATVKFNNGEKLPLTIHYLDSTIDKVIIDGTEGTQVNINLYEFNINDKDENVTASKIEDYTPETLYFKYPDGKAVGLDVLGGWDTAEASKNLFGRLLVNGYSSDVSGSMFKITSKVAAFDGSAPQTVELTFVVKSKKVYSLTINDVVNTISIDPYKYYMYMIGESEENPFPSVVEANYLDEYANPNYDPNSDKSENKQKTIKDEYNENVNVVWGNLENVVFDWNNNNDKVNQVNVTLDKDAYPNSSFTWTFTKTQVAVLRNEVEAVYFDEKLTQSALFIDPFQYLINGEGIKNFPDHAYVQFTNGAVYYMPIAWKGLENFKINADRPAQFRQFEVVIGFDPDVYARTGNIVEYSKINGTLLQEKYVNVQVEDRIPEGILLAGSELVGGTYYIDPVQVLYYGMQPFPSEVTVKYTSGKTSVLEVKDSHWDRNFAITMKGKKNLKVTLRLNDQYSFDFNVEIIDRNNLKSELTEMSIDPYIYTMDERGNRLYDVYADNMNLYQLVGTIDMDTYEVIGRKVATGAISKDYKTFLKYVITYEQDGKILTRTETEIEYIKDFVATNKDTITVVSAEVYEYFNVDIAWNLTEVNYSIADTYTVRATVQAKDSYFNKDYKVAVEVKAKKAVMISGDVQYIMVGGTNLSETAKLTQKLTLNKTVIFDDGSMGTYEVTLDLTKITYDKAINATIRWSTDAAGNQVITDLRKNVGHTISTSAEIADCAMDIEVTVCSGDIAQTCTMKVHVLDNQMG